MVNRKKTVILAITIIAVTISTTVAPAAAKNDHRSQDQISPITDSKIDKTLGNKPSNTPVPTKTGSSIKIPANNPVIEVINSLISLSLAGAALIGILVASVSQLQLTYKRNADEIRKWRQIRNQAIKYGPVGSLLFGAILSLLLNFIPGGQELREAITVIPTIITHPIVIESTGHIPTLAQLSKSLLPL